MVDVVDGAIEGEGIDDVVVDEAETGVGVEVGDVALIAGDEVIDAEDIAGLGQEEIGQMGTDETRNA